VTTTMDTGGRLVLVTGGSGFLGEALLRELNDHPVAALVHERGVGATGRIFEGDVTRPHLGLARREYDELADRTGTILHCAANTNFAAPAGSIRRVNLEGTKRVLELATAADARVCYVSTAFVARIGQLPSGRDQATGCSAGRDEYLNSKQDAEQVVKSSGLGWLIVRPSAVIGDSATGEIARGQGVHAFLRALCSGLVPFVPSIGETLIDLIPQDVAAQAIVALLRSEPNDDGERGSEHWITAGAEAPTAEEMVVACLEVLRRSGREIDMPRFMDVEVVERLIFPAFLDCFSPQDQRLFENFLALATLVVTPMRFPSSLAAIPGGPPPVTKDIVLGVIAKTVSRHFLHVRTREWAQAGASA